MDLTCIRCPMGCAIHVEMENGQVVSVTGNTCPRGAEYAKSEATAPVRTVTSTVRALGGVRRSSRQRPVPGRAEGQNLCRDGRRPCAGGQSAGTHRRYSLREHRGHRLEPRRRRRPRRGIIIKTASPFGSLNNSRLIYLSNFLGPLQQNNQPFCLFRSKK